MKKILILLAAIFTLLAPLSANFSYVNHQLQADNNHQSHAQEVPCSDHCLETINQHKDDIFLPAVELFAKILKYAPLFVLQLLIILLSTILVAPLLRNKFALNPHLSLVTSTVLIR